METIELVQIAFERAVKLACGIEYVEIMQSKCPIKRTPNKMMSKSGDMVTTCPNGLFHYAIAMQNKKRIESKNEIDLCNEKVNKIENGMKERDCSSMLPEEDSDPDDDHDVMHVVTTSEYGIVDKRSYKSPYELGCMIISCIDEEYMSVIQDMRLDKHNCIIVTSKLRMNWHTSHHRLPCEVCGCFLNGIYGLRTHQITEHGMDSNKVRNQALDNAFQIVVYKPIIPASGIEYNNNEMEFDRLSVSKNDVKANTNSNVEFVNADTKARIPASLEVVVQSAFELCKLGDLEALKVLVNSLTVSDRHVISMATDKQGNNLLTWAAGGGFLDMCQYLTDELGLDPTVLVGLRRKQQRGPVHWASRNGHLHIIQWLVNEKQVSINQGTDNGTTALHFAIWQGHLEVIRWVVEIAGCDVNQCNIYGCSASHWRYLLCT